MVSEDEPNPAQEDSDDNIYDDFVEFNFGDKQDKYESYNKANEKELEKLREDIKNLSEENEELKKLNETLKKNLSTLLKTAKNEVQRKDTTISELRSKLDSAVFRRSNKITKDKFTETENWDNVCKCTKKKERSKSNENRSNEVRERLVNSEDKKNLIEKKDEHFLGCDSSRRNDYYREKRSGSSERYRGEKRSDSSERYRERKSYKHRDKKYEDFRKSFRYNYRDHLKYDSLDKKRHSDDSKKSTREKEYNRKTESLDRHKSNRSRSKERQRSSSSKDSSSDKHKNRNFSECVSKSEKPTHSKSENLKEESGRKSNNSKKEEKVILDVFERKSPLEALYSEPVSARNITRAFTTDKSQKEIETEEGECEESLVEEDWALSFKNERRNSVKPLTLYSRRMMKRLSEEEKKEKEEKKADEVKKVTEIREKIEKIEEISKTIEVEKEPGELTDDENIVESSKEFQEITKVAYIENKLNDTTDSIIKTSENIVFKEPVDVENVRKSEVKESPTLVDIKENETHQKEHEEGKSGELVEFSPFKNNYKLIEISPMKQQTKDHVLDFYKLNSQPQKNTVSPMVDLIMSSIKPGDKKILNTKEDKKEEKEVTPKADDFVNLKEKVDTKSKKRKSKEKKIVAVAKRESKSLPEKIKKKENSEEKCVEDKKKNTEPVDNLVKGKRRGVIKKENEISESGEKNHKRKRGESECEGEESEAKKQKTNSENCGRMTRSKKEKKSESDESKEKVKEDISFFEFFKPITSKTKVSGEEQVATTSSGDYKMCTTMSVTSVLCLETPNKKVQKLKNLTINEQMTYHVNIDAKNGSFSPLMTPRRMLKNDLMLTDSEDDSIVKPNPKEEKKKNDEKLNETQEEEEVIEDEEEEFSDSGNSECGSDSGASDFVDML